MVIFKITVNFGDGLRVTPEQADELGAYLKEMAQKYVAQNDIKQIREND